MRIYISGPITGTTDYKERFAAVEEKLKANGYEVVNPAKLCAALPDTFSWKEYMNVCEQALRPCDAIYMLHGWFKSQGATYERALSLVRRKIYYEDGNDTGVLANG